MRGISATGIILIAISAASAAYAAIPCQESAGREQRGVYWSWREIEGKRCWFVREGVAMPPKSMFTWAKEEPEKEEVTSAPEKTKSEPSIRFRMLRIKPFNPNELSDLRLIWVGDFPEN